MEEKINNDIGETPPPKSTFYNNIHSFFKYKKIKIVGILLILTLIVTCIYFGSKLLGLDVRNLMFKDSEITDVLPVENTTRSWNTYKNEYYGFKFKYPDNWYEAKNDPDADTYQISFGPLNYTDHIGVQISPTVGNALTIAIIDIKEQSVENAIKQYYLCGYTDISKGIQKTINEYEALIFYESLCGIAGADVAYIHRNNYLYEITIGKDIDQILSTFTFFDSTASWKTYRNNEYGVEFEYPKNLLTKMENGVLHMGESVKMPVIEINFNKAQWKNYSSTILCSNAIPDKSGFKELCIKDTRFNKNGIEDINIDGRKAVGFTLLYGATGQETYIIQMLEEPYFQLTEYHAAYNHILSNKILSTLTFNTIDLSSYMSDDLDKYTLDPNDKIYDIQEYPKEITSIPLDQLQEFKCTYDFYQSKDLPETYSYYSHKVSQHFTITDNNLITILKNAKNITKDKKLPSARICEGSDMSRFIFISHQEGNGGSKNISYISKVLGSDVTLLTSIPNDGTAYFGCFSLITRTNSEDTFILCGGGDGGFSSKSIYQIQSTGSRAKLLVKCDSQANPDMTGSKISCN